MGSGDQEGEEEEEEKEGGGTWCHGAARGGGGRGAVKRGGRHGEVSVLGCGVVWWCRAVPVGWRRWGGERMSVLRWCAPLPSSWWCVCVSRGTRGFATRCSMHACATRGGGAAASQPHHTHAPSPLGASKGSTRRRSGARKARAAGTKGGVRGEVEEDMGGVFLASLSVCHPRKKWVCRQHKNRLGSCRAAPPSRRCKRTKTQKSACAWGRKGNAAARACRCGGACAVSSGARGNPAEGLPRHRSTRRQRGNRPTPLGTSPLSLHARTLSHKQRPSWQERSTFSKTRKHRHRPCGPPRPPPPGSLSPAKGNPNPARPTWAMGRANKAGSHTPTAARDTERRHGRGRTKREDQNRAQDQPPQRPRPSLGGGGGEISACRVITASVRSSPQRRPTPYVHWVKARPPHAISTTYKKAKVPPRPSFPPRKSTSLSFPPAASKGNASTGKEGGGKEGWDKERKEGSHNYISNKKPTRLAFASLHKSI